MENGWQYPPEFKGFSSASSIKKNANANAKTDTLCTCDGQFSENKVCRLLPESIMRMERDELFQQYCPSFGEIFNEGNNPPSAAISDAVVEEGGDSQSNSGNIGNIGNNDNHGNNGNNGTTGTSIENSNRKLQVNSLEAVSLKFTNYNFNRWINDPENIKSNIVSNAREYYNVKETRFHFNGFQVTARVDEN